MNSANTSNDFKVVIAGAGAAGLWCALRLVEKGMLGKDICLVEPSGKTQNDRTWCYWSLSPLVPDYVLTSQYSKLLLANDKRQLSVDLQHYCYYCIRSANFYAYAKDVLAKAGAHWIHESVSYVKELETRVKIKLENDSEITCSYLLDSRPEKLAVNIEGVNATLQHFWGWFVKTDKSCFDVERPVLMDFASTEVDTQFFYVIPFSENYALVELAVLSLEVWEEEHYEENLEQYIADKYGPVSYNIVEKESGVIPMTDRALWHRSTSRHWNIGTRGGWVQPSSGYAFARCAFFSEEVAESLLSDRPTPWKPSQTQQIFNSTMLSYLIREPQKAGSVFLNLFEKNGGDVTFDFLSERAGFLPTLRLMWNSPRIDFSIIALIEVILRIKGKK